MEKNKFVQKEEDVLKFWDENKIFEKSVAKEAPKGDYVFYDGPPFATGLPHYGHIVASLLKDAVPRFWTMNGYRVARRWGWDCHGLPIENITERELGIKDKTEIEKRGVAEFNECSRELVLRYAGEWKNVIYRIARWVDMDNDYKTMNPEFMESIWWAFSELWKKDLVYKGYKSMHICPRCGTTLSNFEVSQNYQDIKDLSVTAKFELADEPGTYVLAWTTTPWTLPGNVALAMGKDIEYVKIGIKNHESGIMEQFIVSKERASVISNKFGIAVETSGWEALLSGHGENLRSVHDFKYELNLEDSFRGEKLAGKRYKPLFDYFKDADLKNEENIYTIQTADFVSVEDGTGIVHIAPGFGEDDMNLGKEKKLPMIQHVTLDGRFTDKVKDWPGELVKPKNDVQAMDKKIVEYLKDKGLVFLSQEFLHSYPLCWRCETPLLNYATDSWFVKVPNIKERMLANNEKMNWVPENIKHGRFGKWLENAIDWAISRNRYWGTPIPIWICDKCGEKEVIGSIGELEEKSGKLDIRDIHKHFVDQITWECKCGGRMRRINEIFDCWFESGSMFFSQFHYPFENKEKFDKNFPAQFIAEGVDQTRGWFYTLIVLATALFDEPAAYNVIVNGIVLAEDGQKMSKSKNNFPDPMAVVEAYGMDALRYYLFSSPVMVGESMNFSDKGVREALQKTVMLLNNIFTFYAMYKKSADADEHMGSSNILDCWIMARLNELTVSVSQGMRNYNLPDATRPIEFFINDFSTWYLRRSRDRFKGDDEKDKKQALATTGYVLREMSKVIAPFVPFIAEDIWQQVTGYNYQESARSVHLEKWPQAEEKDESDVLKKMGKVRKIVEMGMALRARANIKVRQVLKKIELKRFKAQELNEEYLNLIKDELNIKEIVWTEFLEERPDFVISQEGEIAIGLDTQLTPDLIREGSARELVRQINAIRKETGLTINDQVVIYYETSSQLIKDVLKESLAQVKKDTLAKEIKEEVTEEMKEIMIGGEKIKVGLVK